jgi:hypothetical protein
MAKTLAFFLAASAIALLGVAAPQPASAGVSVYAGPGGVYVGPRHRYYGEDDWYWRHHHRHGAWRYHDHDWD